jgi:hypothetical protein
MNEWALHRRYRADACEMLAAALRCERVAGWSTPGTPTWELFMEQGRRYRALAARYHLRVAELSVFTDNCGFDEPCRVPRQGWPRTGERPAHIRALPRLCTTEGSPR